MQQLFEPTGEQIKSMRQGLVKAFSNVANLNMFLVEQCDNRSLNSYSADGDNFPIAVFKLVTGAQAEGWLPKLIAAAAATRPHRPEFTALATALGLTPVGPNLIERLPVSNTHRALEDVIRGRQTFIEPEKFIHELSALQPRICLITMPTHKGVKGGTGFLVGPDLVLTAYHVMREAIDRRVASGDVEVRFDVRRTPDGATIREGVPYKLSTKDWLVDHRPFSSADLSEPPVTVPAPDELDYCLMRLEAAAGESGAGGSADPGADKRGWIEVSASATAGTANDDIFILQHPRKRPLALAIGRHLGFSGADTRFRYDADTLGGSSGAPVFNSDLKLIGLHHRGDPNADLLKMTADSNQAISINRMVAIMKSRGVEPFWSE